MGTTMKRICPALKAGRARLATVNGILTALLLSPCCFAIDLSNGLWIDLSHNFSAETIYWPTAEEFRLEQVSHGITEKGYFYAANNYTAAEHGGTHIDAPIHFAQGRHTVEQIPLQQLIGRAVIIDVSQKTLKNPDYQVLVEDIAAWEEKHGKLPDNCIVLLNTGYARFWPDRKKYMGTDARGEQAVAKLHFPGLHPETARWLTQNRQIKAIGLDTPSIDYGQSTLFESHRILFDRNIPAFENVAQLHKLPTTGAWVIALPMKIQHGSGAPTRIVAFVPADDKP